MRWYLKLFICSIIISLPCNTQVRANEAFQLSDYCPQLLSNLEFSACMDKLLKQFKQMEKDEYLKATKGAKDYDDAQKRSGKNVYQSNAILLEQSRNSFENYMKDECERQSNLYGASSAAGRVLQVCKATLMQQRIELLKKFN